VFLDLGLDVFGSFDKIFKVGEVVVFGSSGEDFIKAVFERSDTGKTSTGV
jgi:hypothetical protein